MNKEIRRGLSGLIIVLFLAAQLSPFLPQSVRSLPVLNTLSRTSLIKPAVLDAAGLSSASATLSNPRLSYIAGVSTTYAAGTTLIAISGATGPDLTTNHLFPGDKVGIGASNLQNPNLTIGSIVSGTSFTLTSGLTNGVTSANYVYATQSGAMTVNFYTGSAIPVGGSISVSIPAAGGTVSGGTNDGIPDTAATTANNGFDLNSMSTSNITCPNMFTAGTLTAGSGGSSNPHIITCNWAGASPLAAGANLSVVIGSGSNLLVNPGPINGHTSGVSDVYMVDIASKTSTNGGGTTIESVSSRVIPTEGVLVTVSIDESLNFTVAAVTSANLPTTCGFTPAGNLVTTTVNSVPFGSNVTSNTFYNGAQQLTVSTNAPGGYTVKVEESDQMGKDGVLCAGASAGESVNCIKDTTCDGGSCTQTTSAEWTTASNNGLGYTLSNVSGTEASFLRNESSRTFSAKQFADQEAGETKQTIMSKTGIVSGSSACVVYRLSVSGTQPAGAYQNTVKYTASALF